MEGIIQQIDQSKVRFSDAPWYKPNDSSLEISIFGLGSIGSWTSLLISKLGIFKSIFLDDLDNVNEVNLAGQLYFSDSIGIDKVTAIYKVLRIFGEKNTINTYTDDILSGDVDDLILPISISAFDNMAARKYLFEKWINNISLDYYSDIYLKNIKGDLITPKIFIDGRLNAEQFEIFFVTPDKIEDYRKYLFDDKDVLDLPCSFKYTSHFAAGIAYNIVKGLTNYLTNIYMDEEVRDVPFRYFEFGPLFLNELNEKSKRI